MFSWHCCITDTLKLITETNNYIKNKLDELVHFTSLVYGYSSERLQHSSYYYCYCTGTQSHAGFPSDVPVNPHYTRRHLNSSSNCQNFVKVNL